MPIALRVALVLVAVALGGRTLASDPPRVGPFQPAVRTVTIERTNGGAGSFDAILAYPALIRAESPDRTDPTDDPPAIDPAAGACPAVAFAHGFAQPPSRYRSTLEHLASHGYLAVAPASETGLAADHRQLAHDLRSCLTWLEHHGAAESSFLHGAVDPGAFGFSGHSMGGGCAIVAASSDPRARAVAPLAPARTRGLTDDLLARIEVPILFIVGSGDRITPTLRHAGPMYKAARAPKQLLTVAGGFHCGFTDVSSIGCDSGAITRQAQQTLVNAALVDFFDLHLKRDESRRAAVWGNPATPPDGVSRSMEAGPQAPPPASVR